MRKKLFCLIFSAILFFNFSAKAEDKTKIITIAADVWCPVNCDPDSTELGIGIDLAKKIFEPLGYQINYIVVPWARALEDVRQGKIDAVVGANTSDDPALVFPENGIALITDDFYVKADNTLPFKDIASLRGQRLGIIKDYGYGKAIEDLLDTQKNTKGLVQEVSGDTALDQNIKKLIAGRIDILIESGIVMSYKIKKEHLEDQIRRLGGIPQGNIYIAFSPALPASAKLKQQFDEGMIKLKKTEYLPHLYKLYGLQSQ